MSCLSVPPHVVSCRVVFGGRACSLEQPVGCSSGVDVGVVSVAARADTCAGHSRLGVRTGPLASITIQPAAINQHPLRANKAQGERREEKGKGKRLLALERLLELVSASRSLPAALCCAAPDFRFSIVRGNCAERRSYRSLS